MTEDDVRVRAYQRADRAALIDELIVAYDLLTHAMPLAVQRLQLGNVDLSLQTHFWRTVHALSEALDEDPEECVFPNLPEYELNPYLTRHDALFAERCGRLKKPAS